MRLLLFIILFGFTGLSHAQILEIPEESLHAAVSQTIGFTDIDIVYSRPNMKGRAIFGEQVPWGTVWRMGANASTKISFSRDVWIEDKKVVKGKYSMLSIPGKESWTIIFNNDTTLWGHYGYNKDEDYMRLTIPTILHQEHQETFLISFSKTNKYSAILQSAWGKYRFELEIRVDLDDLDNEMEKNISEKLSLPDDHDKPIIVAHNYFHAAMYYLERDKDLNKALEWVDHGIDLKNVNYFHLYKSDILGRLGRYEEAIKSSREGLAMFMKTGTNKEWIWRYEMQIAKWEREIAKNN